MSDFERLSEAEIDAMRRRWAAGIMPEKRRYNCWSCRPFGISETEDHPRAPPVDDPKAVCRTCYSKMARSTRVTRW